MVGCCWRRAVFVRPPTNHRIRFVTCRLCQRALCTLPKLRACAQLEQGGWVAALQAPLTETPAVRRSDSLAVEQGVSREQFEDWSQKLVSLAQQIADAVDES